MIDQFLTTTAYYTIVEPALPLTPRIPIPPFPCLPSSILFVTLAEPFVTFPIPNRLNLVTINQEQRVYFYVFLPFINNEIASIESTNCINLDKYRQQSRYKLLR